MSDTPVRTLEQIQQEFSSLCARAGHCQYQIATLKKDLDILNSTIRDLNLEAANLKAAVPQEEVVNA